MSQQAEDIRRRMSHIRRSLDADVEGIFTDAGMLTDWRYHVKSHPFGAIGLAVALGYFAVPQKLEIVSPDEEALERLARRNRLVVQHKPSGQAKPGVAAQAFNFISSMLMRGAIAYLGQQAGKLSGFGLAEAKEQTKRAEAGGSAVPPSQPRSAPVPPPSEVQRR